MIAALVFLASAEPPVEGIFIVSDAEDTANNYLDVERILVGAFGRADHPLPVLSMPSEWRGLALRTLGRTAEHSCRRYSSDRLSALGYVKPAPFEPALVAYAEYLAAQFRHDGEVSG